MTKQQISISEMQAALARWRPNETSEREERSIINIIERACNRIGVGPLTFIMQYQPLSGLQKEKGELLACPNCNEKRFKSMAAVRGHQRLCKKGGVNV